MSFIRHLFSTCINRDDSAFPTIVRLNNGDLICGYNVGGGPEVTGGTFWARSKDMGETWKQEGAILPRQDGNPVKVNTLRLSKLNDGRVIAYGQQNYLTNGNTKFGTHKNEPVFCVSAPNCTSWSPAEIISNNYRCSFEMSNPILTLTDKRWLAPAAILTDKDHLGEKVIAWETIDGGKTWTEEFTVFSDESGKKGFFEQKLIQINSNKLMAFAWTVELKTYKDLNNHFTFSEDGGKSWTTPVSTTIEGQTLTPYFLGNDYFLLIYNYRKSPQGIRLAYAKINDNGCEIIKEDYLWQPSIPSQVKNGSKNGIDEFDDFAFGLPSIHHLSGNTYLAVFWNKEAGVSGIKCLKFKLEL